MSLNLNSVKLLLYYQKSIFEKSMQWDPMWGISILADFRSMSMRFHAVVVFGLGKKLLFKSVLGHCGALQQSFPISQHEQFYPFFSITIKNIFALFLNQVKLIIQHIEYDTALQFIQSSRNLTSDCLLIYLYLPVFTSSCMMCS